MTTRGKLDGKKLDGKKLAILFIGQDEDGNEDAAVFGGTMRLREGRLVLDRGKGKPAADLEDEWLERLEKVRREGRRVLLSADYVLTLQVGYLTDRERPADWAAIGLEWQGAGRRGRREE